MYTVYPFTALCYLCFNSLFVGKTNFFQDNKVYFILSKRTANEAFLFLVPTGYELACILEKCPQMLCSLKTVMLSCHTKHTALDPTDEKKRTLWSILFLKMQHSRSYVVFSKGSFLNSMHTTEKAAHIRLMLRIRSEGSYCFMSIQRHTTPFCAEAN